MRISTRAIAIVDVISGEQPLLKKKIALSVNGEIYNYPPSVKEHLHNELGDKLYLSTLSDCEPIIPLYEKNYTDDFLNEFGRNVLLSF